MSTQNTPSINEIPVTLSPDTFLDTMEKLKKMLSFINPKITKITMDETNLWSIYEGVINNDKIRIELNIDSSNKFLEIVIEYGEEYEFLCYYEGETVRLRDITDAIEKLKRRVYKKTVVYQKRMAFVGCVKETVKHISLYGEYVSIHVNDMITDEFIERVKICRKILAE